MKTVRRKVSERNTTSPYERFTLDELRRHEGRVRAHRNAIANVSGLSMASEHINRLLAELREEIAAKREAVAA